MSPETELHVLPMEAVSKPPGGNAIFLAGRGATRPAAHRGAVRRARGVRGFEATRDLLGGHRPDASWVGIGLAIVTLATMPPLAAAKRRVGERLGSSATMSESRQTMLCAYLSVALLAGLLANAAMDGGGPIRWRRSRSPPWRCAKRSMPSTARPATAAPDGRRQRPTAPWTPRGCGPPGRRPAAGKP
jgi:hypothetical protein